jgi:transposase
MTQMPSLTRKTNRGRNYWYLRWTARVDGRPKVVRQEYLGTSAEVAAALAKAPSALTVLPGAPVLEFGAVMALYDLAQEVDLVGLLDAHVPRRVRRGPSVGQMLLLATLNRAVAAASKARMATWYARTALVGVLPLKQSQLTSQRFWDAMDRVDEAALLAVERELVARVVKRFDLSVERLFYDATNFFTFVDTFNDRPTLPQRGVSKEGRDALRILGLALLVTGDGEVPLMHRLYPGNHNDPTSFRSVVGELVERARTVLGGAQDLTVVFDKGNNTEDTLAALHPTYHVVGSLVPSHHKELLDVTKEQMRRLDPARFPKDVRSWRTRKKVFGREYTVLVTWNQGLYDAQRKTVERELAKRSAKLLAEQARLARWHSGELSSGRRPTPASVERRVAQILRGQHMASLFETQVTPHPERPKVAQLDWRLSTQALARLEQRELGKTLLFTDREEWTDEEVVTAYRGQHHVERSFRQMKDTHYVSFRPAHHWTDQKLRVHAFCCVVALMLCTLLRRRLAKSGTDLSVNAMLEALATIREVHVLLSSGKGRPRVRRTHSELTPLAKRLFEELGLGRHLAS